MSESSKAVFLSYASQDAEAARRICDALRAAGVEVWFDQSELRGGDAWDQKIRRQIKECALFVPIVSANTQARLEGYFRIEWKLAAQRTHAMAEAKPFLVPIVLDGMGDADAHVPEEFRAVQWTRLRLDSYGGQARLASGESLSAFCERAQSLLGQAVRPTGIGSQGYFGASNPKPETLNSKLKTATDLPAKSVAVLAFANLSHDPENEYFSDGISEELLNVLAKVPGLRVTARTSSFYFKGKNLPVPRIAQELGVSYIVEGSVRKAGTRVRITAQLIDAVEDTHLWSETFDRELKDIFAVQDEIAGLIAQNLQLRLGAKTATARPVNPEVYQLCLEAKACVFQQSDDALARAQRLFARALELEPKSERALIGLSALSHTRAFHRVAALRWMEIELAEAERLARAVLASPADDREVDAGLELLSWMVVPDSGAQHDHRAAHAILALVALYEGRFSEAQIMLSRQDLALGAMLLLRKGRPDLAISLADADRQRDPLAWARWNESGLARVLCGRFEEALPFYHRAEALGPAPITRAEHALALARIGRRAEAVAKVHEAFAPANTTGWPGGFVALAVGIAAWALVEAHAHSEAEKLLGQLREGPEERRWNAVHALLRLGAVDEAVPLLAEANQLALFFPLFLCADDPRLRDDPRIRAAFQRADSLEALDSFSSALRGHGPENR